MFYTYKKLVSVTALMLSATTLLHRSDAVANSFCEETCAPQCCCPDSCGEFFFGAEFLYFRAYEGGLSSPCDRTCVSNSVEDGVLVSRLNGSSHDPDFDWNPGFRIGLGYGFAENNLDLGVFWTNYNSHTNRGGNRNRIHWNLDYNVVDVIASCEYDWSACCSFIPYGGVKYARIHQKLHNRFVSYEDRSSFPSRSRSKEDFYGFGPLFGIAGDAPIGCGFSVYGNISVAILYGSFDVHSKSRDVFDTGINENRLRSHLTACQPVVDAGFGVRWNTCVCGNEVWLQAGLEQHRYFNHNQICGYGDLSLDGASLALGLKY